MKLFKLRKGAGLGYRQIILIGNRNDNRIDGINAICVLDIGSSFNRTGSYSNWRSSLFEEIDSVTLKGLHKSEVEFKRSTNGWITLGEYLICKDKIFKLTDFLEEYKMTITELGLKPIDNLILRSRG